MMCHVLSAQVYLLDDPLAAVDNHVAAWLIEHVLGHHVVWVGPRVQHERLRTDARCRG